MTIATPEQVTGANWGFFRTAFNLGDDTYDASFSIETPAGEFMGVCGVGISEANSQGEPVKVTAFEVWLFDKCDIRTVTNVLMSDHVYYNEQLSARLAPKGEAVLAEAGQTFTLRTSGLNVVVAVEEVAYGETKAPPKSFFRRLVVTLTAFPVSGDVNVL